MSAPHKVIFRDFKHHYHKVRPVAEKLTDKGPIQLSIKFDGSNLKAEYTSPNDKETVRFVVLMRRFLSPSDSLYYKKIWATLQEEFGQEISIETAKYVESSIEYLDKGQLGVSINGENLTAEKIYQTLSDGEYFDYNEDAQKYLQSLADLPIVGPLFWHQFHSYTFAGYTLVYNLFDVITMIEKSIKDRTLNAESSLAKTRCIYCLTTTATFNSEEHIFPESLGNDELVLPKGYVCDKCNNEVLAPLDEALLEFGPVAMLRVEFVPYTKDGKLPTANFQNIFMERTSPRNITIRAKDKTGRPRNKRHLGDDWYSFTIEFKAKRFDPKILARALYKIALGIVALSQGQEHACNQKFDEAREFIRNGHKILNSLIMQMECRPHPQVRIAYRDLSEGTPFVVDIYGLMFILNLESKPVLEFNEAITPEQFAIFPLGN